MGQPKALLPVPGGDGTFLAHLIGRWRAGGIAEVLVVGRAEDEALRGEVWRARPAILVINPDPDRGQLSSLVAGVDEADGRGADWVCVLPVDMPLVRPETMAALLGALARTDASIARVTHGGRHGHPVAFHRSTFAALRAADPAVGAKAVVRAAGERVLDVEVDDPGVLRDVDRPEDYRALFGRDP